MEEFGANLHFFGNKKTQTIFQLKGFLFHSISPICMASYSLDAIQQKRLRDVF
jgi:hypothetical protein